MNYRMKAVQERWLYLFIVDKEGGVSEVKALACGEAGVANCLGPGTKLAEIAVNAIRKGPKVEACCTKRT